MAETNLTIAETLRRATDRLTTAGLPTPRLDAEVLLRHLLGLDRTQLFLHLTTPLPPAVRGPYRDLLTRRLGGEPVAYLTGEREFMGLRLAVTAAVLIPRPETEILVEWALAWLRDRLTATVLDIGTGSGAIALGLAAHLPQDWRGRIVATDRSAGALAVANHNRQTLELTDRVSLVQGDLVSWCSGPVDFVLANLPYLRPDQIEANVHLRVEPGIALHGGPDGLTLIRRLIAAAPRLSAGHGALGLEIDPSQADAVRRLARDAFPVAQIGVLPDLAGLPRHVIVTHS